MNKTDVLIVRKHERARMPVYATKGSACADFFPILVDGPLPEADCVPRVMLQPGEMRAVRLGWAITVPGGWCLELHSRSGQGKARVSLANSTGVIDSDFTGELLALVVNDGQDAFELREDKAVCQGKLSPAPQMHFWETHKLQETARGEGGFGSTDAVAHAMA